VPRVTLVVLLAVLLAGAGAGMAQPAKEVKVGNLLPFSGGLADQSEAMRLGFDFALEEINAAGGVKSLGGAKLRMLYADTKANAEVAAAETERLILREKADILIGAYRSADTLTATTIAEKYKMPILLPNGIADNIVERGYKYLFRNSPHASWFARDLIRMVVDNGDRTGVKVRTMAVINENSAFGQSLAKYVVEYAEKAGIKIVLHEPYAFDAPDLTPVLLKVAAAKPDALCALSYQPDAIQIANIVAERRMDFKVLLGGSAGWGSERLVKAVGAKVNYWLIMEVWGDDLNVPHVKEVSAAFEQKKGRKMDAQIAGAYAIMYILHDIVERAGSLDREALRRAATETNIAKGRALILPQEKVTFGPNGQNPQAMWIGLQYLDGKLKTVWPSQFVMPGVKPVWPVVPWDKRTN
jgi:branched-chain amino acid transport system substrate-binding protein